MFCKRGGLKHFKKKSEEPQLIQKWQLTLTINSQAIPLISNVYGMPCSVWNHWAPLESCVLEVQKIEFESSQFIVQNLSAQFHCHYGGEISLSSDNCSSEWLTKIRACAYVLFLKSPLRSHVLHSEGSNWTVPHGHYKWNGLQVAAAKANPLLIQGINKYCFPELNVTLVSMSRWWREM
jgi:hypothetical protein